MNTPPACIIRGHDHPVVLVSEHVQDETNEVGYVWGCPTDQYRWFQLASRNHLPLSRFTRTARPRFGWSV